MPSIWPKRDFCRRYKKDYGFIRTLYITLFLYFVVWPAGILFYTTKIKGWKNIDRRKRYIYTSNHQSYIDPPLISMVANAPVAYMAKEELYTHHNPLIKFLVISLGSFGINREKPSISTLKTIKDIVNKTNWNMGIFPQGQTNKIFNPNEVKPGFIDIAKMSKMDIVPIAICGFSGYAIFPFTKHVTLKIGKPISYELPKEKILKQWNEYMTQNIKEKSND